MSDIVDKEIRMRCVEQATIIAGRRQNTDPKEIIAIATELCDYVCIGSSPTGSTGEGTGAKARVPSRSGKGMEKYP